MNPLDHVKVTVVEPAGAAGLTTLDSDGVDMTNFDSVMFVAHLGALTATQVTKLKLQQSDDDAATDAYSDIEGSATAAAADADSGKALVCAIRKPRKKWVRASLVRGTANAVLNGITAYQFGPRTLPCTQPTSISQSKAVTSPVEGTA